MFDSATATGAAFSVVTDELLSASQDVLAITGSARTAVLEGLPTTVHPMGDDTAAHAFREFCARWDTGLSHLVGDSETMAQRLDSCAVAYVEADTSTAGALGSLFSCAPLTSPVVAPMP